MALPTLNFNEEALNKESALYKLYDRLYQGMQLASQTEAPTFIDNPPVTATGEVDSAAIASALQGYSDILTKNSAYLFANSIVAVIGDGISGSGTAGADCLSRLGDVMSGNLAALYGFQAGHNNVQIFETVIDADNKSLARVTGTLRVSEDAYIDGALHLSNGGIKLNNANILYYSGNYLNFVSDTIKIAAKTVIDGTLELGRVIITQDGVFLDGSEFYHSSNANNSSTDWAMCDADVYGDLNVHDTATIGGLLNANSGICVKYNKNTLLSTQVDDKAYLQLNSDLSIASGYGVKFDKQYVIQVRNSQVVEFSAPNLIMNLGSDTTQYIALQSGIYDYSGAYQIISKYGDGNFRNSLSAGCGNSGDNVLQTFFVDANECGVAFAKKVRFGEQGQPMLWGDGGVLIGSCPYTYILHDVTRTNHIQYSIGYKQTTSPFRDLTQPWSATLSFNTDAEFVAFEKPIEAKFFAINSELYKTRLAENTLFFDDGKFIEGIADGIRYAQNSYFDGNLSSTAFSSGFAGYGWSIRESSTVGGYAATFDELTVRKKMRIYELEVQKLSFTNGSQWVSDACSGDEVREIV